MSTIENDKAVSIHYTLTLDGGQVVDSSSGKDPLVYLHGHNNIIPGLERELAGKAAGEHLVVRVEPQDGYGVANPQLVQEVPREALQGVDTIEVGTMFQASAEDGSVQMIRVVKIEGESITIDGNHELAGKTLNFDVRVDAIRDGSAEELTHGHVHGPGGHQH